MSAIIKSTPEAIQAIATMQAIVDGGLADQVHALTTAGDTAGDQANWDGPLASQFRATWVDTKGNLTRLLADLAELRQRLHTVQSNIQSAGGAG